MGVQCVDGVCVCVGAWCVDGGWCVMSVVLDCVWRMVGGWLVVGGLFGWVWVPVHSGWVGAWVMGGV